MTAHEEKKNGMLVQNEEAMQMLRADDSESEESDIFNAISDR